MSRLLSELPGAAQIVAYQEEDPDPTVVIPTLTRNPSVFSFSAVQNGSSPAAQSLTITNTGPGTLAWTASSNSAWLTLNNASSASGTNLGSVGVRVNPAGLSVGTHSGLITIVGTGAANSPQMVTVSFDVTAAPTPTIGLSATTLSFSAVQGGSNPANKTISVSNSGSGTLNWTATESASWLSLSPASGTGSGTISVAVNTSGLSVGTVSTPITIAAAGATNTPQTVTVSLTITTASLSPAIGVSPASLSFTAQQGGSNPSPQTVTISNRGGGILSWAASDNATWVTPFPYTGTGNGTVSISALTGSLTPGTYTGAVMLNATGATQVTIPVTFTVTPAPITPPASSITLTPSALAFTATQGAANPASKTISLSNPGTNTLTWTVTDTANWLSVTPAAGTTSAAGTNPLTASVNTAGLASGSYSATITITGTGVSNSPQTIPVTLTMSGPATSSATLTWSPSTEPDLQGYKVYMATSSGAYPPTPIATLPKTVGNHVATNLPVGTTIFFTITAYDTAGNESIKSNEVSKSIF